jgi:micrococcal nuclease
MRDAYWRRANVLNVVDGDTVDMNVDLGFYVSTVQRFRLLGIDAYEMRQGSDEDRAEGRQAKDLVQAWCVEHRHQEADADWPFVVRTEKSDSFGRFLAHVECSQGHSLEGAVLDAGLAVEYRP